MHSQSFRYSREIRTSGYLLWRYFASVGGGICVVASLHILWYILLVVCGLAWLQLRFLWTQLRIQLGCTRALLHVFALLQLRSYWAQLQVQRRRLGGVSKPGNLNGSRVRDPFAGALDFYQWSGGCAAAAAVPFGVGV